MEELRIVITAQAPTPDAKLGAKGTKLTCMVASPVFCRSNDGESCIMLETGPTNYLVAKFPQHSWLAFMDFLL